MNNRFINFLQWATDDEVAKAKDKYHPIEKLMSYEAEIGDKWRLLVKKNVLQGIKFWETRIIARLAKAILDCKGVWQESFENTFKTVQLRPQLCEKYIEFNLLVNGVSTAENYKQFALMRQNGQTFLGPIKEIGETIEQYASKIKEHFERYPYAKVICMQNGPLLNVRVFVNDRTRLNDEELYVGLGPVDEINSNNPSIQLFFMDTIEYEEKKSWNVVIGNVEPGNIFQINDVKYEAQTGDDAQTVLKALIGDNERLIVPASEITSLRTTKGVRYVVNKNTPSLQLTYFDNSGGNDRYIVSVGESIRTGNVFQITATGQVPKTVTATANSTSTSIKNALVMVSGYYEVSSGTIPTWAAVAGLEEIKNTNNPILYLNDLQIIDAVNKDKYRVIIGNDVVKGNEFTLLDKSYVASSDDNAYSVALALGLSDSVDYIEVDEGAEVNLLVKKGNFYTNEDIANVEIVDQPRIKKSGQIILEIDFNGLQKGTYCVQLFDEKEQKVLCYSNFIEVVEQSDNSMVEVADNFQTNGYEYFEKGLTQTMRLPVYLRMPMQSSSENRSRLLDGSYRRSMTSIKESRELITKVTDLNFNSVLASWLKHNYLWINQESLFMEGEYSEMKISELSGKKQAKATLVKQNERNNKSVYYTSDSTPMRYGVCMVDGFDYGVNVFFKTLNSSLFLQRGENLLEAAEYNIIIYNEGDERLIRFAPEGFEKWCLMVPGRSVIRARRLIRIESDETLEIICEKLTAPTVNYSLEHQTEEYEVFEYSSEETSQWMRSFGEDFNNDFAS